MTGWTSAALVALPLGVLAWWVAPARVLSETAGLAVYQSEGCVHCHSQYSRPSEADTLRYGPASPPPDGADRPVLIGNRRQGPDLSAIGIRRSREWNRLHLIDPRSVSPGSRMPAYGHLFTGDARRGEALLDYLGALGIESAVAWLETVASWRIDPAIRGDAGRGAEAYARSCAPCHGREGGGDGPVGLRLVRKPANLASGTGLFVPDSLPEDAAREVRARIIKFGLPGTSMPGHEYLTDQEIADLIAFLAELRGDSEPTAPFDENPDRGR